jgi:cob(I)alamin adenosyltransferase
MKLYTKTGDDGTTGLFGGDRVSKADARVDAYGEVDEANAALGLAAVTGGTRIREMLKGLQDLLFVVGAELASPGGGDAIPRVTDGDIARLEGWIDEACARVAPLRTFVLPGGSETAARLHLARGVVRRAERATVRLAASESVDPRVIIALNRISDLLFALARFANHEAGVPDVPWEVKQSRSQSQSQ